jgi:hypothetical protein
VPPEEIAEAVPSTAAVAAALGGMAAAWIAAGSVGLMTHALRHALVWAAVAVVLVVGWPRKGRSWRDALWLIAAAAAAIGLTVPAADFYNVLAVAVVLAALAWTARGVDRQLLAVAASGVAVFGLYRLAFVAIPTVWSIADAGGYFLGRVVGAIWQKPLWLGAGYGGVDFLVLTTAVAAGWLLATRPPRTARAVYAVAGMLAAQLAYLTVLAFAIDLAAWLPSPPDVPPPDLYVPPPWSWSAAVRSLLPWNVPLVGAVVQLAIAAAMFRWAGWSADDGEGEGDSPIFAARKLGQSPMRKLGQSPAVALVLAVVVGPLAMLWLVPSTLEGKKVVAFGKGYLNWDKPVYDKYGQAAAGMYGMLPTFVAGLGGSFEVSDDLAAEDLADADLLLLLHPVKPWPDEQVARVWEYVRSGGSLLVVGEPRVNEDGKTSAFDEVLGPSRLRVRYDVAVPRSSHWQECMLASCHPAALGADDRRGRFGMINGSSIDVRWPGRPILVGRWGWSDPGSDALLTDVSRFEQGEKLGDLVLAAEQPVGRGRVVVLGDAVSLTNVGNVDCYPFTGRLLSYLAGGSAGPQSGLRQALALAACLALAVLLVWLRQPALIAAAALLVALAASGATAAGRWQSKVLPNTEGITPPAAIACIDASHVEAFSDFDWTNDGLAGLKLTLMRNGYFPLLLPELDRRRLAAADLLISIGPARRFSGSERRAIDEFVRSGGLFIVMAGAEQSEPINEVLAAYGFHIPHSPLAAGDEREEPRPMGNFRTPFEDGGDYPPPVVFYAGWPIQCPVVEGSEILVHGFDNLPVAGRCRIGEGTVVVIGDTEFAMNKNLEYAAGGPLAGGYENAHFWRWLLARLTGKPKWMPPKPESEAALTAALKEKGETAAEPEGPKQPDVPDSPAGGEEAP